MLFERGMSHRGPTNRDGVGTFLVADGESLGTSSYPQLPPLSMAVSENLKWPSPNCHRVMTLPGGSLYLKWTKLAQEKESSRTRCVTEAATLRSLFIVRQPGAGGPRSTINAP